MDKVNNQQPYARARAHIEAEIQKKGMSTLSTRKRRHFHAIVLMVMEAAHQLPWAALLAGLGGPK